MVASAWYDIIGNELVNSAQTLSCASKKKIIVSKKCATAVQHVARWVAMTCSLHIDDNPARNIIDKDYCGIS